MAPTTIAIHRHKMDPVSPIPVRKEDFPTSKSAQDQAKDLDQLNKKYKETKIKAEQMKREKLESNRKLTETNGMARTLQNIPVGRAKSDSNTFLSVQRKIEAIAFEMQEAKKKYDLLSKDESWHNDTIKSQVVQMESIEEQIHRLNKRLKEEESEQQEAKQQKEEQQKATTEDLEHQIILKDMEIMNILGEINTLKRNKDSTKSIGDIQKLEEKLAKMQQDQKARKLKHENVLTEQERSAVVLKPTESAFEEISKLEDNLANLRLEQEQTKVFGEDSGNSTQQQPVSARRLASQPWNRDLVKKGAAPTELEVVANAHIDYDDPISLGSVSEEQNPLSIPSLHKSSKKKKVFGIGGQSISSETTTSDESESESEASSRHQLKKAQNNSDTSDTEDSSTSSFTPPPLGSYRIAAPPVDPETSDDDTGTNCSSLEDEPKKNKRLVELRESDDGSVEASLTAKDPMQLVMSESTDESESDYTTSSSEASSNESSTDGEYTLGESTQSESRSVLEKIPEEGESEASDSDSDTDEDTFTAPKAEIVSKEQQVGNLILVQQLKDSQDKYVQLMEDYNCMMSKSELKMKELQEENQKLRDEPVRLKEENQKLLDTTVKQDKAIFKANKSYEQLQKVHANTLKELEEKKDQYDLLMKDTAQKAHRKKDNASYARLEALHERVVMKLADMGEENDKLEKERDEAISFLESQVGKIRAYDEAIAELKTVRADLKHLQDVHTETIEELQELAFQNKELKGLYEKETGNGQELELLQIEHANILAELEVLKHSSSGFSGVEGKLNQSEVRATMLEEELKKTQGALGVAQKKSFERDQQLKDVIVQYKALQKEHNDKCAKLARLELAVDGINDEKAINEMKAMEKTVDETRKQAQQALKAKQAREDDMRIVLQHYEKLQKKYERLRDRYDAANDNHEKQLSALSLREEEKKEEDERSHNRQHELQELLNESKQSLSWKDEKISEFVSELTAAKDQIEQLENEKKELEVNLSGAKSELLLARKEATNAESRQGNGEDHLKKAIAEHKRLEQTYSSLLKKFGEVKADLEKTKKEAKAHEENEKDARKRVATIEEQYKKLQDDHDVVVERLEKLKVEMST